MIDEMREKMDKSIENLKRDFASIRSGAAHPSLLEDIMVDAYGNKMVLSNLASVSVQDRLTLTVQVWDQANVTAVDKALRASELSLNPKIDGSKLFITFPPLTTERRQEFIKIVKNKAEEGKVSIRNLRRTTNDKFKDAEKNGEFGEDELNQQLKKVQEVTDQHIMNIDEMVAQKEKDLSTI